MENNTDNYDDIINLPHPISKKHPRMSLYDRAAQFAPFAALTGHSAAIKETERLTESAVELGEDKIEMLNEKLRLISENIDAEVKLAFTYFVPDEKKSGGKYITHEGVAERLDENERQVVLKDKTIIPFDSIVEIDGSLFGSEYI